MSRASSTKGPRREDSSGAGQGDAHALEVERLTKRFGDRTAFSDVSFTVDYGEVFGFLGPNGAGKTTTVRTLGNTAHSDDGLRHRRRACAGQGKRRRNPSPHRDHARVAGPLPAPQRL